MVAYLTKKQVAQQFQVTERTINKWMNQGMPYLRVNERTLRFEESQIKSWLDSRNQQQENQTTTSR